MVKANLNSNLPNVSFVPESIVEGTSRSYNKTLPQQEQRFIQSGHLIDQQLKTNKDNLTADDLGVAKDKDFRIGINLPAGADLLVNTLSRVILEKRKNSMYLGNHMPTTSLFFGNNLPAPRFETSLFELAKENSGRDKPTGQDLTEVEKSLAYLSKTDHYSTWYRDGLLHKDIMLKVIPNIEEVYNPDNLSEEEIRAIHSNKKTPSEILRKGRFILTLSPIFALDIDGKFIQKPSDMNIRLRAVGGKQPSEALRKFSNYLLRCCSTSEARATGITKIRKAVLIETLGLDIKYKGRKAVIEKNLEKTIQACIDDRLPLLLGVELTKSKKHEEDMYIFHLNIDFANKRLPDQSLEVSEEAA